MKQLTQNYNTGELKIEEVPIPALKGEGVLVQNAFSLISAGTERTTVSTAQKTLAGKAVSRPDLVRQVVNTVKQQGIMNTYALVKNRLNTPIPLGYSSAGIVIESNCPEFSPQDQVACAGAGYASHAEIVYVPKNLAVKVPDNVSLEHAAFSTLGAVALQGIRQGQITLGENVLVIGLGLLGQLTVQILKAHGCRVFGTDLDEEVVMLAKSVGANEAVQRSFFDTKSIIESFTNGYGFDAVIITAATSSNDPIELAGNVSRDKGRVIIVGAVKADIPREPFYSKELDIRFSRSYGPGRYDVDYEEKGIDYPYGYVRWTEKRNMEAFLNLVAEKRVNIEPIISHRFKIDDAQKAYDLILGKTDERALGVLLEYEVSSDSKVTKVYLNAHLSKSKVAKGRIGVGFIGAGSFAQSFLLPQLIKLDNISLTGVVTASGINAKNVAEKFGFSFCSTSAEDVLQNDDIDCVFIATRHNLHAKLVTEALKRNKHVYVEKPLALNENELNEIIQSATDSDCYLAVGFNRRFSPFVKTLRDFIVGNGYQHLVMNYRINAGSVQSDHWTQEPEVGGGRIIGEVCHFVDTLMYLCGSRLTKIYASSLPLEGVPHPPDNVVINIIFANGSVGNITYTSVGDRTLPKERIEVFAAGTASVIDDFRSLEMYSGGKRVKKIRKRASEKGHKEEILNFLEIASGKSKPMFTLDELVHVTQATFKIQESLALGKPVEL